MIQNEDVKNLVLNTPQAKVHLINANKTYCAWARGTGKTSGVHGPRFLHLSEVMPRCQIGFITDTYERFRNTISKAIEGFVTNEMGLVEGVDFIMFKKPPEHWTKPLYPVRKYDHVISFATGVALIGGSMAVEGSFNGQNIQAFMGDEMKFVKENRLTEARRALRGAATQFGHLAEYRSEWYTTDKYGEEIWWYLNKRKLMDKKMIAVTLKLALRVEQLRLWMQKPEVIANKNLFYKYFTELNEIEARLVVLRKNLLFFSEASLLENIDIIGREAYDDLVAGCATENERLVALENKDPERAENMFYPDLSDANMYESSGADYNRAEPLIFVMDYQWRLSPVVVAQVCKLPGSDIVSLNFIDAMHSEVGLTDALQKLHEKYKDHPYRNIIYFYDHTAVGKNPVVDDYRTIVTNYMIGKGWNIQPKHMGQAPDHDSKYENTKKYLKSDGLLYMLIRINKTNCGYMIQSMLKAEAVTENGKTQKCKKSEKNLRIPAVLSTHYSDCFDQMVCAVIDKNLVDNIGDHIGISVMG